MEGASNSKRPAPGTPETPDDGRSRSPLTVRSDPAPRQPKNSKRAKTVAVSPRGVDRWITPDTDAMDGVVTPCEPQTKAEEGVGQRHLHAMTEAVNNLRQAAALLTDCLA